jgi:hypothetical protein
VLVASLPRMMRYLKDRGVYVLFNTNGTVLSERNGRALIDAGLDELRVSLDASNRESFKAVRGRDYFGRIIRNVRAFRELQEREGHTRPQVSVWLTGLRETVEELPAFVKVAAEISVKEVYLQRLVFFAESAIGKAQPDQALFERLTQEEAVYLKQAEDLAHSLGVTFSASGAATEPGLSLKGSGDGSPWSLCRRPWSLMYFTANGRALPCCIAPFSQHGYDNYTLGHARAAILAGDLERARVSGLSCGAAFGQAAQELRQLRPALEPVKDVRRPVSHRPAVVSAIIPCLDEETAIGQVVTAVLAQNVSEVVVVDGASRDRTAERAEAAGARVIVEPRRGYGDKETWRG